jgi:hypothetical protein
MRLTGVLEDVTMKSTITSRSDRCLLLSCACALALSCLLLLTPGARGQVAGRVSRPQALIAESSGDGADETDQQTGQPGTEGQAPLASAMLQQCLTAADQSERSAVFSGEMNAIPGSVRMAMRIDVQEQLAGEALFHTITAAGLGVWRSSDAGVKSYRYIKQVTNLSAPAFYRAVVGFRWLNAKGRLLKSVSDPTPRCVQPVPPSVPPTTVPSTGSLE